MVRRVEKKRGRHRWLLISVWAVLVLILIVSGLIFYLFYFNGSSSSLGGSGKKLVNPAYGLSLEEAVKKFDESFVSYLLVNIGAFKLHNPPFSSNTPKIGFYVGGDIYGAEIVNGRIFVSKDEMDEKDIIIKTNKEEAIKMIMNSKYVGDSFRGGKSSIELVAGKLELASKGYLGLYSDLS